MLTQKYIEITFEDCGKCFCRSTEEVEAMTFGCSAGTYAIREVEMTQEQFDALPDFEG